MLRSSIEITPFTDNFPLPLHCLYLSRFIAARGVQPAIEPYYSDDTVDED